MPESNQIGSVKPLADYRTIPVNLILRKTIKADNCTVIGLFFILASKIIKA
jgi:hypothetical protein